jgi:hypothetical protein
MLTNLHIWQSNFTREEMGKDRCAYTSPRITGAVG